MLSLSLSTTLLARLHGRQVARPLVPVRVRTHLGDGSLRYVTDDGYVGVHLDVDANERRVEEIGNEHVQVLCV